jgi:hypothetical protein
MPDVQDVSIMLHRPRGLAWSLGLAVLLAAIPLQPMAAAAHDPIGSGAGMGTRAPLMLETGARLAAPGTAAGMIRVPTVPSGGVGLGAVGPSLAHGGGAPSGAPLQAVLLAAYGRFQLEGG